MFRDYKRGAAGQITLAANAEVSPILLVRVLDIPLINDPSTKDSLYLTNSQTDIAFFDENDIG